MWAFHDTSGFHQKELTHTGQRLQFVPPGGGVTTVTVQSVTGSAIETGYVIDYSFEGSSNGYLTQKYQRLVLIGRLRGSHLDVTYSEAGLSSFGDKTGLTATEGAAEYQRLAHQTGVAPVLTEFLAAYPEYRQTLHLDALRASEYARLDASRHVYLDYTGGGLHAASQVSRHVALLDSGVWGNPHSASPASAHTTALVEEARRAVRQWFNAGPGLHRRLHAQRHGRAEARGGVVSLRDRRAAAAHRRQSQFGERHSRDRQPLWRDRPSTPRSPYRSCGWIWRRSSRS